MKKTTYMVGKATHPTRAHIDGGGATTTVYVPQPYFGQHPTNIAAKRAFAEAMEPDLKGTSDDHIRGWCKCLFTNLKHFKVVKVESEEAQS